MKTMNVTLYIHDDHLGGAMVSCADMTHYGYALLGTEEIDVTIPDGLSKKLQAEALYSQAAKLEDDAAAHAGDLRRQAVALTLDECKKEMREA